MSTFQKKLAKYSKSYLKKLEKQNFDDETHLVLSIIGLLSINTLIMFTTSLSEMDKKLTGMNSNVWYKSLKVIEEKNIHNILMAISYEYLEESSNHEVTLIMFPEIEHWRKSVLEKWEIEDIHLVDKVFKELRLEDASRNEVPVMTFTELINRLFDRLDGSIEKGLLELHKKEKQKNE